MRYIKISIRRLLQNKSITLFNITGFAISMILMVLIAHYVISELSYKQTFKDATNIYFVSTSKKSTTVNYQIIDHLAAHPHVKQSAPIYLLRSAVWQLDNQEPFLEEGFVSSPAIFEIAHFDFLLGNPGSCLTDPFQAVITESFAKQLFGSEMAIGKNLKFNNEYNVTISAVIKDIPKNSLFGSKIILSYESLKIFNKRLFENGWGLAGTGALVQLSSSSHVESVTQSVEGILPEYIRRGENRTRLITLKDYYFDKELRGFLKKGNMEMALILSFLGLLILIVSIANYFNFQMSLINLNMISNSTLKIFGGNRMEFFKIYFYDSLLISVSGMAIALFAYFGFLQDFLSSRFAMFARIEYQPLVFAVLLVLILIITLITSAFGVLWVSRHNIVHRSRLSQKRNVLSKTMLVFQFATVVVLIVSCTIINKQIHFMQNSYQGYNKENVICVQKAISQRQLSKVFYEECKNIPGVQEAVLSTTVPGQIMHSQMLRYFKGGQKEHFYLDAIYANGDFLKVYEIELVKGRTFIPDSQNDHGSILLSESYAKNIRQETGIHDLVGHVFSYYGGEKAEVVGIIKDVNTTPMHNLAIPFALVNNSLFDDDCETLSLKIEPGLENQKRIIESIKGIWAELSPDHPLNWYYLDEQIDQLYKAEEEFAAISIWTMLFAGIITILGLIGMVTFTAQRRIKEIGIRKVNGARIAEILSLFNKDFIKWVVVAFVFACPISWYIMNKWLENFAYKTSLSWWVFTLAGIMTMGIALLTISIQSYKAASRNPVEALRYE